MQLLKKPISIQKLKEIAQDRFGDMIKAVVDVEKEVMVIDAELHSDQEKQLLKEGAKQQHLWGINLYPELFDSDDFVEFDSMINLRPTDDNHSRGVDNPNTRQQIKKIVNALIQDA